MQQMLENRALCMGMWPKTKQQYKKTNYLSDATSEDNEESEPEETPNHTNKQNNAEQQRPLRRRNKYKRRKAEVYRRHRLSGHHHA